MRHCSLFSVVLIAAAWQRQAELHRSADQPIVMVAKDDCFECGSSTDGTLLCGGCRTVACVFEYVYLSGS